MMLSEAIPFHLRISAISTPYLTAMLYSVCPCSTVCIPGALAAGGMLALLSSFLSSLFFSSFAAAFSSRAIALADFRGV